MRYCSSDMASSRDAVSTISSTLAPRERSGERDAFWDRLKDWDWNESGREEGAAPARSDAGPGGPIPGYWHVCTND